MEIYDRPHKKLERKRSLFFRLGLMISLLITFLAFEWKTAIPRTEIKFNHNEWDTIEEVLIPITRQKDLAIVPQQKEINRSLAPKDKSTQITIIPDERIPTELPVDSFIITDIFPIVTLPEIDTVAEPFYLIPEINPVYPGEEKAMQKFLENNIRFPEKARDAGMDGTVYVNFIIDETGKVTNIECIRSPGILFTEEALRVVQLMPRWKPGYQGGKPVRVKMSLPVTFRLL